MASASDIKAIRVMQKAAAANGDALSFIDAKKQLSGAPPVDPQIAVNALQAALTQTKAEIAELRGQLLGLRITGPGFSGEGEKIMFIPGPSILSGGDDLGALTVKDEGTILTANARSLNFVGSTIAATASGQDITVTLTPLAVKEEGGTPITPISTLHFVGSGLTASLESGTMAKILYTFEIVDQASSLTTDCSKITFSGAGVVTTGSGAAVTVTVKRAAATIRIVTGGAAHDWVFDAEAV